MSNHLIIDNAVPTDTFKAIQQDLSIPYKWMNCNFKGKV